MKICDRNGNVFTSEDSTESLLISIYNSTLARACINILSAPFISKAGGIILNSKFTAAAVPFYAEKKALICSTTKTANTLRSTISLHAK